MKPTSKVVAVDADELIAAFIEGFIIFHNNNYGTSVKKEDIVSFELGHILNITEDEVEARIEIFFKTGEAKNIKTVENSLEGIDGLIKKGYELHIITARPLVLREETLRWIGQHFPDKFKEIHFGFNPYVKNSQQKTKAEICKEIGAEVLMEDNLANALNCAKNGITVLLMDAPWNQTDSLPENIIRVKSWEEILEKIDKLWT